VLSAEAVGIEDVSSVRLISGGLLYSLDSDTDEGEGERTTEGIRACPGFRSSGMDMESAVLAALGSQVCPGLIIKLTMSPSLILYSLRSLGSASALPLSTRRCASACGARGWEASKDLMDWMVSVGWTGSVNDWGGFNDLNVRVIEAAVSLSR
jgi:hypothetical protein